MGTSRSVSEFAMKLDRAADEARRAGQPSIARAAARAKRTMEAERNRVVGADGRFTKSGIRFGVGYNVARTSTRPTALVFPRGPWGMIEGGTKPHSIVSRHGGGTRRGRAERADFIGPQFSGRGRNRAFRGRTGGDRRAVLNIAGIGFRRSARHPGTRGRQAWSKGQRRVFREAPRQVADPVFEAIRRPFR